MPVSVWQALRSLQTWKESVRLLPFLWNNISSVTSKLSNQKTEMCPLTSLFCFKGLWTHSSLISSSDSEEADANLCVHARLSIGIGATSKSQKHNFSFIQTSNTEGATESHSQPVTEITSNKIIAETATNSHIPRQKETLRVAPSWFSRVSTIFPSTQL